MICNFLSSLKHNNDVENNELHELFAVLWTLLCRWDLKMQIYGRIDAIINANAFHFDCSAKLPN
jgi:hypothetical protein